jgi:rhamnogalacturonan endolyase
MFTMRSALLLTLVFCVVPIHAGELFRSDFSELPARVFSAELKGLTNATQEYHYIEHRGVSTDPWEKVICHDDAWLGGSEDGKTYLEQHTVHDAAELWNPTMMVGDPEWSDYTVEVKMKPLSEAEMAGVVFRYRTNRHYYLFGLRGGDTAFLTLRLPFEKELRKAEWKELATAEFDYDTDHYYTLKVENIGSQIRASINGKIVLEAKDDAITKGKAGVTANIPTRFMDFVVTADDSTVGVIRARIARRETELQRLRAENPQPKLWKKFKVAPWGAGRNVRFGDLNGDGQTDMLIAQDSRHAYRNSFAHISTLAAYTFDGELLWTQGRPDPYNDVIAHDTPFQIHDIDGDGDEEVVMVKDFKIQILDGKTGKLKKWAWMPKAPADNRQRPYERELGDSIAFFNFTGDEHRRDIVIKDRYRTFWVFNNKLEQLWTGQGQLGHFPYPLDMDGDGLDEMVMGFTLWDNDGRKLWSHATRYKDHSDGIVMGNFSGDPDGPIRVYSCASDEGYILFDIDGGVRKHIRLGHAQTPSIADYRKDVEGLELMVINFWKNPGIVTLLDYQGNILEQAEPIHTGSPVLPVNWRGDGQEFALLSGNSTEGGMIDGHLRRVVMFPDDGHPDYAFTSLNVTGDARDEIILWDQNEVWIYTQDRPHKGGKLYAPIRNPEYNESNYRTTVSLPNWK